MSPMGLLLTRFNEFMKTKPKIEIDLDKVEMLASRGLTLEQIATSLGISVKTLERRKRDMTEMSDAIKRGRDKGVALIANKLYAEAKDGNVAAMIFFLKTQGGWKEKQEVDVKHSAPVQVVFKDDLED